MCQMRTCISHHALDIIGDKDCTELPGGGPVCPGRHRLVDAHNADPVSGLAGVHEVILSIDVCAPGQLPRRGSLGQLLQIQL